MQKLLKSGLSHLLSFGAATQVPTETGVNHLTHSCFLQDPLKVAQVFPSTNPEYKNKHV